MADSGKTKKQLIAEIATLRDRLRQLEGTSLPGQGGSASSPEGGKGSAHAAPPGPAAAGKPEEPTRTIEAPIPVLVVFVDRGLRVHFGSRGFLDWFEGERRGAEGKHIREAMGDATYRKILPRIQAALAGEEQAFEFEAPGPDGSLRSVQARYLPHFGTDGTVLGLDATVLDITDRKRAEEALQESERKYRNLVETSQDLIWSLDQEGRFTYLNPAWELLLGYSNEEMLGRPFTDFKSPEEAGRTLRIYQEILKGHTVTNHETTYLTKTGKKRILNFKGKPLFDFSGKIIGTHGTAHDITERKRAEGELRNSQRLLQTVFDTIPSPIYLKDREGRYRMVNHALAREYAMEPDALVGLRLSDLPPGTGPDPALIEELDRKVLESGETVEVTRVGERRADGVVKWWRIFKAPHRDDRGEIVGIVGISEDITERRQAEEDLRASEKQVRLIADNLPVLIAYIDAEERYRFVNRQFLDWYGLAEREVIGRRVMEITAAGYEKIQSHINKVLAGENIIFEQSFFYPMRKDREVRAHFVPHFGESGEVEGFFVLVEDITDQKQLEDQLRQSQKMEALGTLAGGIAHDFNNLLHPILGFTELALENLHPESEDFGHLTMVSKSANRAKELVAQILLFSRHTPAKKEQCNLARIAEELLQFLRSSLPATVTIQKRISADLSRVDGDPSQLHQMMLNLAINAGQAMPNGGQLGLVLENVQCDRTECLNGKTLSGKYLRLAVSDTGVGMDGDTLAHIFEPFFTTRETGEGTGLGLATVYGIVQLHEGGIAVTSVPGQGTTFEVFLPAVEKKEEMAPTRKKPRLRGTESILFIDDEEANGALAKLLLEKLGYRVTILLSSIHALQLFQARPGDFDLVITDLTMPEMTGDSLAGELRKIRADIPIILCTGYSDSMNFERAKVTGINEFLDKPIEANDLARVIRSVLDGRKKSARATPTPSGLPVREEGKANRP